GGVRARGPRKDALWPDPGASFHPLEPIDARLQSSDGLWVRRSSGTMGQWTHPLMFARLGANAADYATRPNADATLVGLATGHTSPAVRDRVYHDIVVP